MDILRGWDYKLKDSAVSLGKFDGVHLGHRILIDAIKRQKNYIPTIFTFDNLGQQTESVPFSGKSIYSQEEKDILLEQLGIEREILFPFNDQTRAMEPEQFIQDILVEKIGARFICVGEDFRFGRDRTGNVGLLKKYAGEFGYKVQIFHKQMSEGEVVSSTLIRKNLQEGNLERVNDLLGGNYFIVGKVLHGNALGRTLEMPTANLLPSPDKLLLPTGVYATRTCVDGFWYPSVTNIGKKPTVGTYQTGVETCILNFKKDIYGQEIRVQFVCFLRQEKKFPGLSELRDQLKKDKKMAMAILSKS